MNTSLDKAFTRLNHVAQRATPFKIITEKDGWYLVINEEARMLPSSNWEVVPITDNGWKDTSWVRMKVNPLGRVDLQQFMRDYQPSQPTYLLQGFTSGNQPYTSSEQVNQRHATMQPTKQYPSLSPTPYVQPYVQQQATIPLSINDLRLNNTSIAYAPSAPTFGRPNAQQPSSYGNQQIASSSPYYAQSSTQNPSWGARLKGNLATSLVAAATNLVNRGGAARAKPRTSIKAPKTTKDTQNDTKSSKAVKDNTKCKKATTNPKGKKAIIKEVLPESKKTTTESKKTTTESKKTTTESKKTTKESKKTTKESKTKKN